MSLGEFAVANGTQAVCFFGYRIYKVLFRTLIVRPLECHASSNKCIASSNKCLTSRNKKLLVNLILIILTCYY